jgi:hypothetical protein
MGHLIRAVGGALLWACCVAGVAVGSWLAIDSAGRQVGLSTAGGEDVPVSSAAATTGTPSGTPTTVSSPSPSGTRTSTRTTPPSRPPATSPPEDDVPDPVPTVRRVRTRGGAVELECTGTEVSGYSVWPAAGWSGDVRRTSAETIVAMLHRAHDDTIVVHGSCASDDPDLDVDHDGSGDHEHDD